MRNEARLVERYSAVELGRDVIMLLFPESDVGAIGMEYAMDGHSGVGRRREHEKEAVYWISDMPCDFPCRDDGHIEA